jgi:divalent metal cation (Fe/Co/Zn/Cd) transporter
MGSWSGRLRFGGVLPDVDASQPNSAALRQARVAEALTALWMVLELGVAVWAGVAAHSIALVAFGVDSGIELVTALVVLRLLLLHSARATDEELDRRERQASRIVGWALYALIAYVVVSSAYALATGSRPVGSLAGIVLAVTALIAMPALWRWRLGLARRLGSPSLRADAACSLVCAYMSATLLAGLLLNRLFGWWWADPLAALAMLWWIRDEAAEAREAARTGCRCED